MAADQGTQAPARERPASIRSIVSASDPFSPVRLAPVSVNGTSVPQVGVEIQKDAGDWEAISIHSQGYQLIPNSLAKQAGREIMSRSSLEWSEVKIIWTGRFLSLMYRSDRIVEIPAVGDAVSLGLRLENSYDGSAKLRLVLMAFVLSCTNGLMSPKLFKVYTLKHTMAREFDIKEAVEVIREGARSLEVLAPKIGELSRIPLNVKRLASVAKNIDLPNRDWGHVLQQLEPARSMWDLCQALTHRVTSNTKGRSLITTSETIGDYFLTRMVA